MSLHEKAKKFWSTPSFTENNLQGEPVTYTPSQIAMNNRRKAGLYCYEQGFRDGFAAANEIMRRLEDALRCNCDKNESCMECRTLAEVAEMKKKAGLL